MSHFSADGYLLNIARGGIVDTDALVAALEAGNLAGAALDVVDPYPLPRDHPLWDMPQVIITPHVAGYSREALADSFETAMWDAYLVLQGLRPRYPVPEHRAWVETFPPLEAGDHVAGRPDGGVE